MGFPSYQRATYVARSAQPGAKALAAVLLEKFPGARNGGIYNARRVRGRAVLSVHAEGRAIDIMVPNRATGTRITSALLPHVGKLGIQAIINNRKIWSKRNPKGARYKGVSPHYDHVHIELTRPAAKGLTKAAVRAALSGAVVKPVGPSVKPVVPTVHLSRVKPGLDNSDVAVVQKALKAEVGLDYSSNPGRFGPLTQEAYRRWQIKYCKASGRPVNNSTCDGKPGIDSLRALGARRGFKVVA